MQGFSQIHYYNMCINAFAKEKNISLKDAFNFLDKYKGIEFLVDCYDVEHTLSIDDAVEDLTLVCGNNGGYL